MAKKAVKVKNKMLFKKTEVGPKLMHNTEKCIYDMKSRKDKLIFWLPKICLYNLCLYNLLNYLL